MAQHPDEKPLIAFVIINYRNDKTKKIAKILGTLSFTQMEH